MSHYIDVDSEHPPDLTNIQPPAFRLMSLCPVLKSPNLSSTSFAQASSCVSRAQLCMITPRASSWMQKMAEQKPSRTLIGCQIVNEVSTTTVSQEKLMAGPKKRRKPCHVRSRFRGFSWSAFRKSGSIQCTRTSKARGCLTIVQSKAELRYYHFGRNRKRYGTLPDEDLDVVLQFPSVDLRWSRLPLPWEHFERGARDVVMILLPLVARLLDQSAKCASPICAWTATVLVESLWYTQHGFNAALGHPSPSKRWLIISTPASCSYQQSLAKGLSSRRWIASFKYMISYSEDTPICSPITSVSHKKARIVLARVPLGSKT